MKSNLLIVGALMFAFSSGCKSNESSVTDARTLNRQKELHLKVFVEQLSSIPPEGRATFMDQHEEDASSATADPIYGPKITALLRERH